MFFGVACLPCMYEQLSDSVRRLTNDPKLQKQLTFEINKQLLEKGLFDPKNYDPKKNDYGAVDACRDIHFYLADFFRKNPELLVDKSFLQPLHFKKHHVKKIPTHTVDAFASLKTEYNMKASEMLPMLRKIVADSENPLRTAALVSMAGNMIDFGMASLMEKAKSDPNFLKDIIMQSINQKMGIDHFENFMTCLEKSETILFLSDNCGEVFFFLIFFWKN